MHQIAERNLVTMSIKKVEVRFLLPEKFKTHTSFSFSTAFLNIFLPGSWDLLTWQPWCCNMAMLSKGHLTGIISGIPATSVPRDSDQIRLEIPSLTIFDHLYHRHLLANFNASHHIKSQGYFNCGSTSQADFVLNYFLSNLIKFPQTSLNILKFPLKFSISSQPGWQAGTIKATLLMIMISLRI